MDDDRSTPLPLQANVSKGGQESNPNYTLVRFSEPVVSAETPDHLLARTNGSAWRCGAPTGAREYNDRAQGCYCTLFRVGVHSPVPACDVLDRLDGRVREKCMVCRLV